MSVLPIQNVSFTKSKMSVLQNPKCQFYITKPNLKKDTKEKDAKEKRCKRKKWRKFLSAKGEISSPSISRTMRPAYHYAGLKTEKAILLVCQAEWNIKTFAVHISFEWWLGKPITYV